VRAYGLEPLAGDIGFALRSGRQPVSPAEVVLGPDTADRLGVQLGERVRVAPETGVPDPVEVVVVGIALFPDDDSGSLVDAIGYFGPAFAEHSIVPDLFEANAVVVRVAPGLDVDDVAAGLERDHPGSVTSGENVPTQPGEVAYLSGIRSLPRWLAAFVALLGIASLAHVLLTTRARRRAELATLRSMGLTPRQTVACIVWQAVTITLVGIAIGVPLGMIAGDTAWFAVADPIGVAADASKPVGAFCATALAALVVAGLVAIVPGWRASRPRPAESLRTE
jgi:putative ABC transport system permease protein